MAYQREVGRGGVEEYFVKAAKRAKCLVRKLQWGCRNGAPDRLIIFPDGRLFFVELKSPGKEAKAHQLREHARLMGYGQRVYTIDTKPKVDAFFEEFADAA